MNLARVHGVVVATKKDPQLEGIKIYLCRQVDCKGKEIGKMFLAVDGVGAREGDLVIFVHSREAAIIFPGRTIPAHMGIVGIVDEVQFQSDEDEN